MIALPRFPKRFISLLHTDAAQRSCRVENLACDVGAEKYRAEQCSLLGAKGIATRSKDATSSSWPYY